MMERHLWPALRSYWHAAALSRDLTDKPLGTRLLDERIALFRLPAGVVCLRDLCIHRGTPLSLGWTEGDRIICAYHGWNYNERGACVKIPAVPGQPIPAKARVPAYRCAERYGLVWVCFGEPRVPIPECPEWNAPGYSVDLLGPYAMKCSAARHMENFVDQAHFAWVHDGILGDRAHPETVDVDIERHPEELRYSFTDQPNPMHPMPHQWRRPNGTPWTSRSPCRTK
jgi:phenylpropionate dioxygenase-like ring-hydroxylating dioxygenase large terminal subunit